MSKLFNCAIFRSTLLGNFIRKILTAAGCDVKSINYLGDWGIQFAMLAAHWQNMKDKPTGRQWSMMSTRRKVEFLTRSYVDANAKMESSTNFKERVHRLYREMEESHVAPASEQCEAVQLYAHTLSPPHPCINLGAKSGGRFRLNTSLGSIPGSTTSSSMNGQVSRNTWLRGTAS